MSEGFILWRPWTSVLRFHVNPSNSCWDIKSRGAAPAETEPCKHLLSPLTTCNRAQHEPSWQWWTALYAIPSEAHEAVSIHKRRSPRLLVFQRRCSASQLHNSLVLIWAEQSQETPNTAGTRLVHAKKDLSANTQRTSSSNLPLRPAWLWTALELRLW